MVPSQATERERARGGADVVVTEDLWGEAFDALAADFDVRREPELWADRAALSAALRSARAVVVRNRTQVDAELIAGCERLAVIGRAGVGLDNIDVAAADERGVVVVAPLGANARSVAELALGLALDLARGISRLDRGVRAGGWDRTAGWELAGRTWGLLGAGATGRAVAELATAIGMRVLAYDPYADAERLAASRIESADVDAVLARSDVISVHLPSTPQTRGFLGADALARMRPTALLINVGRGDVVDEAALAAALRSGALGGAGLDVRASEPPGESRLSALDGLSTLDNVVSTPHIAGVTAESQARITDVLAADIRSVLDGGEAASAVGSVTRVVADR